jgi:hypothetical protein
MERGGWVRTPQVRLRTRGMNGNLAPGFCDSLLEDTSERMEAAEVFRKEMVGVEFHFRRISVP